MKATILSVLSGCCLSFVGCSSTSKQAPRFYLVDGYSYCALHKERLVGLKLPVRYGYRFGVVDPLKYANYPNYLPWLNGGDLFGAGDPKEAIAVVCLSCRNRYEKMHPTEKRPNQSLEPTPTAGTSAAEQPLVPAAVVAHL